MREFNVDICETDVSLLKNLLRRATRLKDMHATGQESCVENFFRRAIKGFAISFEASQHVPHVHI